MVVAAGCDPVAKITVRFLVHPGEHAPRSTTAAIYWVKEYEGRIYVDTPVVRQQVTEHEVVVTTSECCGTAAAYNAGKLWFLGCVTTAAAAPVLVCGKVGDPEDQLHRSTVAGTTCDAIGRTLGSSNLDLATCTVTPIPR